LRLHIPPAFTLEDRKTLVQTWEQNLMLAAIPPLINYWEPIMGDGTRFYALMNRFLPDWRERESRLNHPPLR
jgi:predicted metal-dependent hydrolase